MDLFMDKLAQKFNAQEMINANRAADAEEKRRLQAQLKEYEACLEQMCRLKQDLKKNTDEILKELQEKLDQFALNEEEAEKTRQELIALKKAVGDVSSSVNENVHRECVKVYRNVQAVIQEKADSQKAGLEEIGQNIETAKSMILEHKTPRGMLKGILSVSILALIVSVATAVFHVLQYLNLI